MFGRPADAASALASARAMASHVASGTASTRPSPRIVVERRRATTVASDGTRSPPKVWAPSDGGVVTGFFLPLHWIGFCRRVHASRFGAQRVRGSRDGIHRGYGRPERRQRAIARRGEGRHLGGGYGIGRRARALGRQRVGEGAGLPPNANQVSAG